MKVGDKVELKASVRSTVLTVTSVKEDGSVVCSWDEGKNEAAFDAAILEVVPDYQGAFNAATEGKEYVVNEG